MDGDDGRAPSVCSIDSIETMSVGSGWSDIPARLPSGQPRECPPEADLMARLRATGKGRPSRQHSGGQHSANVAAPEGDLLTRLRAAQGQVPFTFASGQGRGAQPSRGTSGQTTSQPAVASATQPKVSANLLAQHLASMDQNLKKGTPSSDSSKSEDRDRALRGQQYAEEIAKRSASSGSTSSDHRRRLKHANYESAETAGSSNSASALMPSSTSASAEPLQSKRKLRTGSNSASGSTSGSSDGMVAVQQSFESMQASEGRAQDNATLLMEVMMMKEKLRLADHKNCDNAALQLELKNALAREAECNNNEVLYKRKLATLDALNQEANEKNIAMVAAMTLMRKQKDENDDNLADLEDKVAGIYARHAEQLINEKAENDAEWAKAKAAALKERTDAADEAALQLDKYEALFAENAELVAQGKLDTGKLATLMAWSKTATEDHKDQVAGLEELLAAANAALAAEQLKNRDRTGSEDKDAPKGGAPAAAECRHAVELELRRQLSNMQEKNRLATDELLEMRLAAAAGKEAAKPKAGTGKSKISSGGPSRTGRVRAGGGLGSSRQTMVSGIGLGRRKGAPMTLLSSIQEDDEVSSNGGAASSSAPGLDDIGNLSDLEEEDEEPEEPDPGPQQVQASESSAQYLEMITSMQKKLLAGQQEIDRLREQAADDTAQTGAKITRLTELLRLAREGKRTDQAEVERLGQEAFKATQQHTTDMEAMLQELNAAKLMNEHREEHLRNKARQQDADYAKLQEDLHFALEGWRLADGRLEDFKDSTELSSKKESTMDAAASGECQESQPPSSHGDAEPLVAMVSSLQEKLQQAVTKCNLLENNMELKEATWVTEREDMQRQHAMALADQRQNHQLKTSKLTSTVERLRRERDALEAERAELRVQLDKLQACAGLSAKEGPAAHAEGERREPAPAGRRANQQPQEGVCWQEICWQLLAGIPGLVAFQCVEGPGPAEIQRATAPAWEHWGGAGAPAGDAASVRPLASGPFDRDKLAETLAKCQVAPSTESPRRLTGEARVVHNVGRKEFHSDRGPPVTADVVTARLPAEPAQGREPILLVVLCPAGDATSVLHAEPGPAGG